MRYLQFCETHGKNPFLPESKEEHRKFQAAYKRQLNRKPRQQTQASGWLRTLRKLHREREESQQAVAQIDEANRQLRYRAPSAPSTSPLDSVASLTLTLPAQRPLIDSAQPVRDALALAETRYAAHAAEHPELAAEFELRYELQGYDREQEQHQNILDALPLKLAQLDKRQQSAPPAPNSDHLPLLLQAQQQASQRLAEAVAWLETVDPRSRESWTAPAKVQRLRDREGKAASALARAKERHATAVAAHAQTYDFDRMRRHLTDAADDAERAIEGIEENRALALLELPPGPPLAPLREERTCNTTRQRRVATTPTLAPAAKAQAWGAQVTPDMLDRMDYDPRTGRLTGANAMPLRVDVDTVGLRDSERRLVNVPKGILISLLHLQEAHYLVPTLPHTHPHRWAWDSLIVKPQRDKRGRVHATDLERSNDSLA